MQSGNFSISLPVKDISASKAFYEAPGFAMFMGDVDHGWAIMQNGHTNIGMFETYLLTFNPSWDHQANQLPNFTDICITDQLRAVAMCPFHHRFRNGHGTFRNDAGTLSWRTWRSRPGASLNCFVACPGTGPRRMPERSPHVTMWDSQCPSASITSSQTGSAHRSCVPATALDRRWWWPQIERNGQPV